MMKSSQISTASWATVCYGIDAAAESSIVVRAERRGRGIKIMPVDFDQQKIEEEIIGGAAVAAGMPAAQTIAVRITSPFKSESKAAKVFPTLLDIQLPFPLEECLYDFTESFNLAGERGESAASDGGISTLAIAARKCDAVRRIAELNEIGVDPHVLDHEGLALWTQLLREYPVSSSDQEHDLKIIVFMRKKEGILVIGRDSEFRTYHRINPDKPAAIDRYLRVQLNKLGINSVNTPPKINWFWTGCGYNPGESGAKLKAHTDRTWPGNSITPKDSETFLARALATRALMPGPLRANLRSGELAHAGARAHIRRVRRNSAVIVMTAGLLLSAAAFFHNYSLAAKHKQFESEFSARIKNMTGYAVKAKGANAILIAERELEALGQQQKPLLDAFRPSLLNALQITAAAIERYDIKAETLKLTEEGLSIKAAAAAEKDALSLSKDIAAMGYKTEISAGDSKNSEKYTFVLTAEQGASNE